MSNKSAQGVIDSWPSGALRVRVDAGTDVLTGKRNRLVEHVPAEPGPWSTARP
ncbi:hypothetical protein [Streptomyces sp. NPDC007984]|uniref:hypothetical protein n=1 Tax=Streptomyces sp. NPDC007984 TaxID=3364801 RepID=UPI0036E195F1